MLARLSVLASQCSQKNFQSHQFSLKLEQQQKSETRVARIKQAPKQTSTTISFYPRRVIKTPLRHLIYFQSYTQDLTATWWQQLTRIKLLFQVINIAVANSEFPALELIFQTQSRIKQSSQLSQVGTLNSKHLLLWLRIRQLHQMQCHQLLSGFQKEPVRHYRAHEVEHQSITIIQMESIAPFIDMSTLQFLCNYTDLQTRLLPHFLEWFEFIYEDINEFE